MSDLAIGWALLGIAAVLGVLVGFGLSALLYGRRASVLRVERDNAREVSAHHANNHDLASQRLEAARRASANMQLRMSTMLERDPATGRIRKVQL